MILLLAILWRSFEGIVMYCHSKSSGPFLEEFLGLCRSRIRALKIGQTVNLADESVAMGRGTSLLAGLCLVGCRARNLSLIGARNVARFICKEESMSDS